MNFDRPRSEDSWSTFGSINNRPARHDSRSSLESVTNGDKDNYKARKSVEYTARSISNDHFHILVWPPVTLKPGKSVNGSVTTVNSQPPRPGRGNFQAELTKIGNSQNDDMVKEKLNGLLAVLWNNPRTAERRAFRRSPQMKGKLVQKYAKLYPKSVKYAIYLACKDIFTNGICRIWWP